LARPVHFRHAAAALQFARESSSGDFQVLICDEILNILISNLLVKDQLLNLIDRCRNRVELIFTGRSSPAAILDQADYVTEMIQVKHPYYRGGRARKGIEY
jgi:cob(I)alamin adenosyltransferase